LNGNPSKLCPKTFSSHINLLRSIEPGLWHSSIETARDLTGAIILDAISAIRQCRLMSDILLIPDIAGSGYIEWNGRIIPDYV
jgi:hypothetical protein